MPIKNAEARYGLVAKTFHWLLFLMILSAIIGGNLESSMEDGPEKNEAVFMHISFGLTILILAMLRLTWRLYNTQPAPSSALTDREQSISRMMHYSLYGLMLAVFAIGHAGAAIKHHLIDKNDVLKRMLSG